MKLRQLLSWRFSLMFFHRWLGIILLLMFLAWTTSGFILMYAGIPHMEAGERLNRLPPLDTSTITITPQQAWQATGRPQQPFRLRLSMRDNRPVYEVNTGFVFGNWTLVYADTGEVKAPLSAEQAMAWMRQTYPEYADSINFETTITGPDMYTHSPGVQTYMPMHRINLGDAADTDYYVSAGSAEVVMKTTRLTRLLGFFGYNIHTLFFFRQAPWQTTLLHWLSWAGLALAVLGVTLGIWRFSLKPLYVQRGTAFRTPYSGWWRWHHYAGLAGGLFMICWLLSGLISMGEIPGITETLYTPDQIAAGSRSVQGQGPFMDLSPLTVAGIQRSHTTLQDAMAVSEMELLMLAGEPWWLAYRQPTREEADNWRSFSAFDFNNSLLDWEHLLVPAEVTGAPAVSSIPEVTLLAMAEMAMPGEKPTEIAWVEDYDSYYYPQISSFDLGLPRAMKTLPVLRVKYEDPLSTWLYLTPSHAQMLKLEIQDRRNRWGYYGMHGWDFSFLRNYRPLWDVLVILMLLVTTTLVISGTKPAVTRLWRHFQRKLLMKPGKGMSGKAVSGIK